MLAGAKSVKIHGQTYTVQAQVAELTNLSAHADADELLRWLEPLKDSSPNSVYITHGEPQASLALKESIDTALDLRAQIPVAGQQVVL